nr:hypothetical protein [Mycobacterium sp. JS623]
MGMHLRVAAAALGVLVIAGCSTSPSHPAPWPGKFFSNTHTIDFYDQTYNIADVKILCSQDDAGLKVVITAPDGTQVTAVRPKDGSQRSNVDVVGGDHAAQTLVDGAVWKSQDGEWGFEGNPDDTESHSVFYLHDGAAICPAR